MTDTRDEREWTIYKDNSEDLPSDVGGPDTDNGKEGIRVVSLSRLQEAERERDSAWKARDRQKARADAAEAVVSRVREWAEKRLARANAEAVTDPDQYAAVDASKELLNFLDLDPVSGGQQDTDQEPSAQAMDREQGPAEGGGDEAHSVTLWRWFGAGIAETEWTIGPPQPPPPGRHLEVRTFVSTPAKARAEAANPKSVPLPKEEK